MNLATIILFVYNRPWHLQQTLKALKQNTLAEKSELIIYSDGNKDNVDEADVLEVRKHIHDIKGFKNLEVIERERNLGLASSVIKGVSEVLNTRDKVIVLEDDVITARAFLTFMNNALEFYQTDKNIFSVSGYTYPVNIPASYQEDVFISYRASSWGWATWKDRWGKADWEVQDFNDFVKDKNAQRLFNRAGEDYTPMLFSQMRNKIDSWAIRWAYSHFKNNSYCLFPIKPLCKNIGTDSSGTHSATTKKFDVKLQDVGDQIKFTRNIEINEEIMQNIRKFFQPLVFRKILNTIKGF
ncbi:glycosyltransferase [bacterium BMS3Abin03]|nr:glycosyltransferase [bacterium BMS3Abin03]MCG6960960.1 glycosyltransferase [bacterium BMS3Abin03]